MRGSTVETAVLPGAVFPTSPCGWEGQGDSGGQHSTGPPAVLWPTRVPAGRVARAGSVWDYCLWNNVIAPFQFWPLLSGPQQGPAGRTGPDHPCRGSPLHWSHLRARQGTCGPEPREGKGQGARSSSAGQQ